MARKRKADARRLAWRRRWYSDEGRWPRSPPSPRWR